MVAVPEFFRPEAPRPRQTVASLDAQHRVARRSLLQALEPMVRVSAPAASSIRASLAWDAHLDRTAKLRAQFYRVRLAQLTEREALIAALCQRQDSL